MFIPALLVLVALADHGGPDVTSLGCNAGDLLTNCPVLVRFCANLVHSENAPWMVFRPDAKDEHSLYAMARASNLGAELEHQSLVWLSEGPDRTLLCAPGVSGQCHPHTAAFEFVHVDGSWQLSKFQGSQCL